MTLLPIAIWYVTGFVAPLYFYKRDTGSINWVTYLLAMCAGLIGPIAWAWGYVIHNILWRVEGDTF